MTSQKFYHEIFILEQNSRNHESFLPQKFGAMRYWLYYGTSGPAALGIKWIAEVYIIQHEARGLASSSVEYSDT